MDDSQKTREELLAELAELRRTESTYRDFFENAVEGIFQSSPEGKFLRVNPALARILGYDSPADMISGLTDLRGQLYVDPRDRDYLIAWLRRHGRISGFETRFYCKDGTVKWISLAAREVRSKSGNILYIEGLNIDISERKKAETAFLDIQGRYRSVFENSIDGVILGTPDGEIIAANPEACSIFNMTEKDIQRVGRRGIIDQDDPRSRTMLEELTETGKFRGELTGIRRGRIRVPLEISAASFRNRDGQMQLISIVRDITQRRLAHEALEESEEKFRRTFDDSPIGASMVAPDYHFLRVNEALCRITGYSEEELLGRTFLDITHPDDMNGDLDQLKLLADGDIDSYELDKRYIHKDGHVVWIHLSAGLVRDAKGFPLYYLPMVQDITERKRTEEALAAARARLSSLMTSSPAVIYSRRITAPFETTFVSDNILGLTGFSQEHFLGNPEFLSGRMQAEAAKDRTGRILEVLEKGETTWEYRLRKADGSIVWVRDQARLAHDENGRPLEIVGYLTDVTIRRQIKEALEESEAHYRAIVEDQTELVCRFAPDGALTFVNQAFAKYFGKDKEELVGTEFTPMLPDEDREKVLAHLGSLRPATPVASMEHRLIMPDGQVRWQQRNDRAFFDEAGRVVEYQSVGRDVTDRVLAEQALQKIIDEKERYRLNLDAVFRSIPEAIVTVDTEMKVIQANRALEEICCIGRDLTPGKSAGNVSGSCKRSCFHIIQKTLSTRQTVEEYRVECKTHKPGKVVVISCSPLIDREGKFMGAVLVLRDITRLADLEKQLTDRHSYRSIVGKAKAMQSVYAVLEQLSEVESTVLVTGESGTGKELVAEALHYGGPRAEGPLVKVNCSALSENLLESELFGHVRGAFTGAIRDKVGRFEAADGGTIFLDEIGDISPRIQLNLLRILERKEYERVGDSRTHKADVRVIAATNVDLMDKIKLGLFRDDLYYRLKVMVVHLPSLRERPEDIPLLADHFIGQFRTNFGKNITRVSDEVMKVFMNNPWPGNVRELKYTLEHACILCPGGEIGLEHLPREMLNTPMDRRPVNSIAKTRLSSEDILQALEKTRNNRAMAARLLGVSRRTLYRTMEKFSLE